MEEYSETLLYLLRSRSSIMLFIVSFVDYIFVGKLFEVHPTASAVYADDGGCYRPVYYNNVFIAALAFGTFSRWRIIGSDTRVHSPKRHKALCSPHDQYRKQ